MTISMIAAHDPNLVIGKDGGLPWHIPEDLKHFKTRTSGYSVIMGRGVFEELDHKPLPYRRNIVLTRSKNYSNVEVCRNLNEVMSKVSDESKVYIIGGEQIYHLFYPICNRLELTLIHKPYQGDTFFPDYRNDLGSRWIESLRVDSNNYSFADYDCNLK